jgi:4-amino-4-deoxy-L-arabinose transferase-like glycosyltransferase
LAIVFVAAALRIWKLADIPPHPTADEAALGYNAYSILKTGKDFWGQSLPIIFKSFGDYTPGLYVYLTVPFVAVFGLNEFAIRLPNVFLGVLVVYLVYLLAKIVFAKTKYKNLKDIALFAAFLAAINPWLIHFSRGAWVLTLSLALTLLGILYFRKALEKPRFILASSFFFALTTLSYQGAKMSSLIVIALLVVIFREHLKKINKKLLLGALAVGVVVGSPILVSLYTGEASRLSVVSVFSYPRSSQDVEKVLEEGGETSGAPTSLAFHSEPLNFARVTLGKWFNHFSARFLFFEGDWENPRLSSPNLGMFLLSDLVLIILGLIALIRSGKNKYVLFMLLWLVLAPLPSVFSRDRVHAARSLHMAIGLITLSALGLARLLKNFSKGLLVKTAVFIFVAVYVLNFIYYLDAYFVHLPKHNAKYWDYGYREAVKYIDESALESRQIVFQQSYEQPFIYFLFYNKLEPAEFRRSMVFEESSVGDVGLVTKLGNIDFRFLSWPFHFPSGTIVVADDVVAPKDLIQSDYKVLKEVLRPDGSLAFFVLEAK